MIESFSLKKVVGRVKLAAGGLGWVYTDGKMLPPALPSELNPAYVQAGSRGPRVW